jgi:hypothetical protein
MLLNIIWWVKIVGLERTRSFIEGGIAAKHI